MPKLLSTNLFERGGGTFSKRYFLFSTQFFKLGLIFVIFDLEVVFLLHFFPLYFLGLFVVYCLLVFILGGLLFEAWAGALV